MKISKRLVSLVKYVEHDDKVADIGCDHALLDIYLIKNKIVGKVLISDINKKALNMGILNVKKYHLDNSIEAKLGFGLDTITPDINTLIISGMGTNTVCKILNDKKINQINKIIVQSNNDHYYLRKYLTSIGYYIADEDVIKDNNKYYINIVFIKGLKRYSLVELKYGPFLILKNQIDYFTYLQNEKINILSKIPSNRILLRLKIKRDIRILNKLKRK